MIKSNTLSKKQKAADTKQIMSLLKDAYIVAKSNDPYDDGTFLAVAYSSIGSFGDLHLDDTESADYLILLKVTSSKLPLIILNNKLSEIQTIIIEKIKFKFI